MSQLTRRPQQRACGAASIQRNLRVLRHASNPHLEMKVWPRGAPGEAHIGDVLPTLDNITHFHQNTRRVGVSREQFFAMVNVHHIAAGRVELLRNYHAPAAATMGMPGSEAKSNPVC